jgi:hypothetical protein
MRKWWHYVMVPKLNNWCDRLCQNLVDLMPDRLVAWAAVKVGAHATTGEYSSQIVPELYFVEGLQRWYDRKKKRVAGV